MDGPASVTALPVVVEHRADLAPAATGDDRLADPQRAALDERGDDRTSALIEVGLEHERSGRDLGVRAERCRTGRRRAGSTSSSSSTPIPAVAATSLTIGVAAPLLGDELLLDELLPHAVGVGVLAVDLGDRDHDRHLGIARVADRLDRLGHHTVVGGHDEHGDVGRLGAAGAHGGERLVTRRVDEGDRVGRS